jgi:hypothetical protein
VLQLAPRKRLVEKGLGDLDSRNAVGHAVVCLDDERLPPAPEAVDQVHLPQWAVARQQLLMYRRTQVGQVRRRPTRPQAMVKQVRIHVERGDLAPTRSQKPQPPRRYTLPELRQAQQSGFHQASEVPQRQWTARRARCVEHHHPGHMHRKAWTFDRQKRSFESCELGLRSHASTVIVGVAAGQNRQTLQG